jgi:6-phosphogluconolactonase
MEIIYRPDLEYLDRIGASLLCEKSEELLRQKEYILWALPGGRSVTGIFDVLARQDDFDWSRIHFYVADERLVPVDDENSNFRIIKERLLDPLLTGRKINKTNIHAFKYNPGAPDSGLGAYKKELVRMGRHFDIILLSSGGDGHIAGLFPGHGTVYDDSKYFIRTLDSPKPPTKRMSSSRRLVAASDTVVLLFYGSEKRKAFRNFLDQDQTVAGCPARIALEAKNTFVLTDQRLAKGKL